MRRTLLVLFFLFQLLLLKGQDTIPNYDFEYWHQGYPTYNCGPSTCLQCPDNWWTFCDFHNAYGWYQDTAAYHGQYALKAGSNVWPGWPPAVFNAYPPQTFPLNFHPAALSCYVKSDDTTNSISISIILYANSIPIDTGKWTGTNLKNSYTLVVIPITHNSSVADSAFINIGGTANSGHYFLIDYLQLDSLLGLQDINEKDLFQISPNPVHSILKLIFKNLQVEKSAIEIFDVLGKSILKSEIHKAQEEINVSDLPSGVYYLKISEEGKSAVKKFVKM